MMACTREEIEYKRLKALERILSKKTTHQRDNCSPLLQSCSNNTVNRTGEVGPFYNSINSKSKYLPYKRNDNNFVSPRSKCKDIPTGKVISGTTYLISEDRFEVKPSEFNEQLINIFKTIPSKVYDSEKRLWNFSLQHYEELQKKVLSLNPHVVLGTIPHYVLYIMRECQHKKYNIPDLSEIDPTLRHKLMPFQVNGVCFGIEKKGRCLIADDMGLGKTFQALAIAHYYKDDWPLLIVTTSSMRETWESKVHELLPSIPMPTIVCVSSGKERQFVSDKQIQDESHLLKSYKAQNTECVMRITKIARRTILLSGTPALSRPSELFTQLQIIDPKFFSGFTEFGKRYCAGKQTNFGWDMTGQSNLFELQAILQKKFLIRRTKDQVLSTLKEKTRESVLLNSSLYTTNDQIQNNLSQLADTYSKKKSMEKHAALLAFFSESARVKIPAVCQYINNISMTNEKFIVFAHHKIVLEAICHTLDENRLHYICIDGSTKSDYRNVLVEKFQLNDSCRVAVLSITAANAGITLTAAQLVIFAELHWNPGILTQAEARAHRIGQRGGVCVRYLLAKGTSDDYMWPMLENKLQVLNKVGLSEDTFENATLKNQGSENTMESYLKPHIGTNAFIAGTNIKECAENSSTPNNKALDNFINEDNDFETSFLYDNEGDELLANVDFI